MSEAASPLPGTRRGRAEPARTDGPPVLRLPHAMTRGQADHVENLAEVRSHAAAPSPEGDRGIIAFRRPYGMPGVEIMDAKDSQHLWVVYHETYTVCTIFDQESEWTYRGRRYGAGAGRLMIMEPGEVHVTIALSGPCTFSVTMLDPVLVCSAASDAGIAGLPHLDAGRAQSPALWARFVRFHQAMADGDAGTFAREALLADAVRALLAKSAEGAQVGRARASPSGVARARDYIHSYLSSDIRLDDLAAVADLSPWHLSREFARVVGVPPHRYQTLVRVEQARLRLAKGEVGSVVAAEVGFSDQSHMIRCFRKVWGVAPGSYTGRRPRPLPRQPSSARS